MSIETCDAIVMRSYPLRDTSLIVHLLTAELGFLKVVAKGARTPGSRLRGALEPFQRISAVIYFKLHRDLQLISKAEVVTPRRVLGRSLVRFAYASAVIELLEQMLAGEEQNPELFALVDGTFGRLERDQESELRARFMGFVVQLLDLSGLRPELEQCVECKRSLEGGFSFDASRGGVVCRRCVGQTSGTVTLTERGRLALLEMLAGGEIQELPVTVGDELARALDVFLRAHLQRYRRLKSLDLLRRIEPRE